jgi:hypothetical protein
MRFLPTENIILKTNLKETEIIDRLSNFVEPKKTFRFGMLGNEATKPYEGRINDLTFDITRIITYKNSFLPRINGVIHHEYNGTTITVKMRLHSFVVVFIFIWCGGVGLGCIAVLKTLLADNKFHPASIIPFGMLIFLYALTMAAFKYESKKSKKDLQTLFDAEITEA